MSHRRNSTCKGPEHRARDKALRLESGRQRTQWQKTTLRREAGTGFPFTFKTQFQCHFLCEALPGSHPITTDSVVCTPVVFVL